MTLQLASAGSDVRLWNISESKELELVREIKPHKGVVTSVRWNFNHRILASSSTNGTVVLNSVDTGEILSTLTDGASVESNNVEKPVEVRDIHFSLHSRFLCTGGSDCLVKVWDIKKRIPIVTYQDHTTPVNCVSFNADADYIASGSESGTIILNSVSSSEGVVHLVPKGSHAAAMDLQYSPLRKHIVGATYSNGAVRIWDVRKNKTTMDWEHPRRISSTCIAFSPFNKQLVATAGLDKTVRLMDAMSNRVVKEVNTGMPLTALAMASDGHTMATGTTAGEIMIYDLRKTLQRPISSVNAHYSSATNAIQFACTASYSRKSKPILSTSKVSSMGEAIRNPYNVQENQEQESNPSMILPKDLASNVPEIEENESQGVSISKPTTSSLSFKLSTKTVQPNYPLSESTKPSSSLSIASSSFTDNRSAVATNDEELGAYLEKQQNPVLDGALEEYLDEMKDEFNEGLQNLHIDMMRQFQSHQEKMEKMMSQCIEGLVKENRLLREENAK